MTVELYKFEWDYGRMGEVTALFFEDPRIVEQMIGTNLVLGEVLGKHSDVRGVLKPGDIRLISLPDYVKAPLLRATGRVVCGPDLFDCWLELNFWDEASNDWVEGAEQIREFKRERDLEVGRLRD